MSETSTSGQGRPLSAADRAILELETGAVVGHTVKIIEVAGRLTAAEVARRIRQRLPAVPSLATRLSGWPVDPRWIPDDGVDVDALVAAVPCPADGEQTATGATPGAARHQASADGRNGSTTHGPDETATDGPDKLTADGSIQPAITDGLDDDRLRAHVADLFTRPLDRSRPLWHVAVAPLTGGRTALIWRLHHALADGVTAVRLASELFWDDAAAAPPGPSAPSAAGPVTPPANPSAARSAAAPAPGGGATPGRTWVESIGSWAGTAATTGSALVGFLAREIPVGGTPSPFDVPVSTTRTVGWGRVSLADLRATAHRVPGATVNDALLAAVTGGLRHWLVAHGRPPTDLQIRVPVSLHHPVEPSTAADPGNADSFFTIALPVHLDDPVRRLLVIQQQTSVRKQAQDARREDSVTRSLQRWDPAIGRFVDQWRADPRRFALAVSNIPGPREPVTVLGHPVSGLTTLAEIGERHGLRVAAISCGDRLTIGFCADPTVVPDVQRLADATAAAGRPGSSEVSR